MVISLWLEEMPEQFWFAFPKDIPEKRVQEGRKDEMRRIVKFKVRSVIKKDQ